jgi:hypothetical protein
VGVVDPVTVSTTASVVVEVVSRVAAGSVGSCASEVGANAARMKTDSARLSAVRYERRRVSCTAEVTRRA